MPKDYVDTIAAAGRLKISRQRVVQLIKAKRLPAERVGGNYLIRIADLALVRNRKPGRPPKADA